MEKVRPIESITPDELHAAMVDLSSDIEEWCEAVGQRIGYIALRDGRIARVTVEISTEDIDDEDYSLE